MRNRLGLLAIVLLASPSAALGTTLRVPADYSRIYEALDAAAAGDTVLVAPGTYGDISVRHPFGTVAALGFIVRSVVLRSEGGSAATILDLSGGEGLAPYVVGIWVQYGSLGPVKIDGFRFIGAPPPPTPSNAVGVRFSSGFVLENCEFEVEDSIPDTEEPRGGVILYFCQQGHVRSCRFVNCRSGIWQNGDMNSSTLVEGCTFSRCQNVAVLCTFESTNTLRDCLFDSNVGLVGSGGAVDVRGVVERCVFVNNRSWGYGGGLLCGTSQVRECLFVGNVSSAGGGGMFAGLGPSIVENCTFVENHVEPGSNGGAAIRAGASSILTLRNNVITASYGDEAVARGTNGQITPACNVYWENLDGNWSGFLPDSTDRVVDPEFCDAPASDYTVRSTSPCLPPNSLGCGLIGAFGEGCGTVSVDAQTWGHLKAGFRNNELDETRREP